MIISLYSPADVYESQAVFRPHFASMGEKCFKVSVNFFYNNMEMNIRGEDHSLANGCLDGNLRMDHGVPSFCK